MRIDDADLDAGFGLGDAHGLGQVRVVADDDGGVAPLLERVEEQVGSEVDVGTLLLGLHDRDGSGALGWWVGEEHPGPACDEVSVVDIK